MFRKITAKIPLHVKFLFKLYLLNMVLFTLVRFIFYFAARPAAGMEKVPFVEKFLSFRMGWEFDSVVVCWILSVPALFFSVAYFFRERTRYIYLSGFYLFIGLQLIFDFICVANIPYFSQFGTHLNKNALMWKEETSFMFGLIFGSFSYWGYLLVFAALAFVIIKISNRFYKQFKLKLPEQNKPRLVPALICFALLGGLITLGMRGRTSDRTGVHEGLAIVSQNVFINQVAINPNFTLWKTLLYNKNKQPYIVPSDIKNYIAFTRNYLGIKTPYAENIERKITDSTQTERKPNIVLVLMESMSVYKMGYYGGKNLTPNLHKLVKESVFCENFFSSGIHTFNGLFSTSTGYPSIYSEKAMKSYVKIPFDGIGPLLSDRGYETYFYTTHDPHFDNMEGFFRQNKFEHITSSYDFNPSQSESNLGVPDHLLLDKLIETTGSRKNNSPFLAVLMTASDHGPWKIPTYIPYKPKGENEQQNCTLYADWSIGRFMEQAKKQSWYSNTVFIFLGDHGLSISNTYEMPLSYNHIPCIIHQPAFFGPDTISSPCYQPDIAATVMGITGMEYTNKTFGINIFKEKHPFVVFSADDKVGCVSDDGFYFYKTLSNDQRYLRKYKNLDPENYTTTYKSKADSMEKNMMMIYETARYFIRKNYFLYE